MKKEEQKTRIENKTRKWTDQVKRWIDEGGWKINRPNEETTRWKEEKIKTKTITKNKTKKWTAQMQ